MPTNNSGPIRIVVVDDSQTVQDMLVALLEDSPNMEVVGTGSNGAEAVRLVNRGAVDATLSPAQIAGFLGRLLAPSSGSAGRSRPGHAILIEGGDKR